MTYYLLPEGFWMLWGGLVLVGAGFILFAIALAMLSTKTVAIDHNIRFTKQGRDLAFRHFFDAYYSEKSTLVRRIVMGSGIAVALGLLLLVVLMPIFGLTNIGP